jgi:probable F420-dependent oxidoreductase
VAIVELGRIGIWSPQLRDTREGAREAAAELDELGYSALWVPDGPDIFERARELLDATRRVVVATGIASIWTHPPAAAAAAHRDLTRAHPGRFLLGLGVSHKQVVDKEQAGHYSRPLEKMQEYLDALDSGANPVPREERVLASLGPRMLALARERSAGAHPYLVTVEHTKVAREVLGPNRLLAPEQGVVLEADPVRARAIGRRRISPYLQMPNYTNSWLRLGFTASDLAGGGSDRLVDGLVAWGTTEAIRNRIMEHHRAGADHVCIQVLAANAAALPEDEWRTLAAALRPASVPP